MKERNQILALTQAAFLSAVAFTFLGFQFIMPPVFIILLWIVPTVFALQAYYVPWRLNGLAGILVIALASAVFGIIHGVWIGLYFLTGSVVGIGWRYRWRLWLRLPLVSVVFCLSLFTVIAAFGYVAGISWQDIANEFMLLVKFDQRILYSFMGVGLVCWSLLLAFGSDRFLAQVLRHLQVEAR